MKYEDEIFITLREVCKGDSKLCIDSNGDDLISFEEAKQSLEMTFSGLESGLVWLVLLFGLVTLDQVEPGPLGRLSFEEEFGFEISVELRAIFNAFDENDDGLISYYEFDDAVRCVFLPCVFVKRAIQSVDKNGDDNISLEELKNLANTDTVHVTIMNTVDVNGDGHFTYNELKNLADPFERDPLKTIIDVTNQIKCLNITHHRVENDQGQGSNRLNVGEVVFEVVKKLLCNVTKESSFNTQEGDSTGLGDRIKGVFQGWLSNVTEKYDQEQGTDDLLRGTKTDQGQSSNRFP